MIKKIKDKQNNAPEYEDSGFSAKVQTENRRLLNKDGSFNSRKVGLSFWDRFSLFHSLHAMSWTKFILVTFAFYSVVNLVFSFLYLAFGVEGISGAQFNSNWDAFLQAFYFSCQTITTVGFGSLSPDTHAIQLVSSLEAFIGLMLFAIMTGILYGRFSKPRAQFVISEKMIESPYLDGRALMFRLANAKNTDMIDAEIQLILGYEDQDKRKFSVLNLERSTVNFLATSWTVVHPLDEMSPLQNWTQEDFKINNVEFIASIKAYDNTFDQLVNSRTSYKFEDMEWNQKFVPVLQFDASGNSLVDLSLIGAFENA